MQSRRLPPASKLLILGVGSVWQAELKHQERDVGEFSLSCLFGSAPHPQCPGPAVQTGLALSGHEYLGQAFAIFQPVAEAEFDTFPNQARKVNRAVRREQAARSHTGRACRNGSSVGSMPISAIRLEAGRSHAG